MRTFGLNQDSLRFLGGINTLTGALVLLMGRAPATLGFDLINVDARGAGAKG